MGPVRQNPIQRTVSLFICVCIALCTIVAHNIAQNRPDSFLPYPPDNHHCSDDVYLREGGTSRWWKKQVVLSHMTWQTPPSCCGDVLSNWLILGDAVTIATANSDINIGKSPLMHTCQAWRPPAHPRCQVDDDWSSVKHTPDVRQVWCSHEPPARSQHHS